MMMKLASILVELYEKMMFRFFMQCGDIVFVKEEKTSNPILESGGYRVINKNNKYGTMVVSRRNDAYLTMLERSDVAW